MDDSEAGPAWESGLAMARPVMARLSRLADEVSTRGEHDGDADDAVSAAVGHVRDILASARGVVAAIDANARSLTRASAASRRPRGHEARWAMSAARGFEDLTALYLSRESRVADMASRAETPYGAAEALRAAIELYGEFLERLDLARADLTMVTAGGRLQ